MTVAIKMFCNCGRVGVTHPVPISTRNQKNVLFYSSYFDYCINCLVNDLFACMSTYFKSNLGIQHNLFWTVDVTAWSSKTRRLDWNVFVPLPQVKQAVIWALQAGYRHIDCAAIYDNEAEIGEALHETVGSGKVTPHATVISGLLTGRWMWTHTDNVNVNKPDKKWCF